MHCDSLGSWVHSVLHKGLIIQDRFSFDEGCFDWSGGLVSSASITTLLPNFYLCGMGFGSVLQLSSLVVVLQTTDLWLWKGKAKLDHLKSVTEMLLGQMSKLHVTSSQVKETMSFKHPEGNPSSLKSVAKLCLTKTRALSNLCVNIGNLKSS